MDNDLTLGDLLQIEQKARTRGPDSLTRDELDALLHFAAIAERLIEPSTEEERADDAAGMAIFKDLTPEEQERYRHVTAKQLQAAWEFEKEHLDDETPDEPVT